MTTHTDHVDSTEARGLRRDAEQNRQRIIRAAREVFAAQGLRAGFNEIAHHAGLGVGTVYRRFPDKETLVAAALEDQAAVMLEVAQQALTADRAWDGLMHLLERGLSVFTANRGLRDAMLASDDGAPAESDIRARFVPYIENLLVRAQAEGDLRAGVTVEDIAMLQCMLSELARHSAQTRPDAWRRYLLLFTDGLRARDGEALHPDAPNSDDTAVITRQWIGYR